MEQLTLPMVDPSRLTGSVGKQAPEADAGFLSSALQAVAYASVLVTGSLTEAKKSMEWSDDVIALQMKCFWCTCS